MKQRLSSRLLVFNSRNDLLLFRFTFDDGPLCGQDFWSTPGGGLENGETYQEAAKRELFEETGLISDVGEEIGQRNAVFKTPDGEFVEADERYFFVKVTSNKVITTHQTIHELKVMKEHYWWSKSELMKTDKTVFPENIIELINQIPEVSE